ncbi:heat shock 70 kDa protein 12A-like [Ylistrum balloti]|uniref:heat shock 70 kDa protein 12A-like n=1 Tax=Ylistrum balloti TaxID=509963 RepID=UPI002905926D|nr:heat shock 70 kDa protein 12A-like [Ylistrum balloti]
MDKFTPPVLSAAINIGDTHWCCGVSSFTNPQEAVVAISDSKKCWNFRTALLLNPDKSFHSFGCKAEENYADITEAAKDQHTYYYFRNLHNIKKFHKHAMVKDETGKMFPLFDILVHSIRFMKELLERRVGERCVIIDSEIVNVLTIPARWDSDGKQLVRQAAQQAGIQNNRCIVVLEPVVAALGYCAGETHDEISFYKAAESGAAYIVLDLRGKTSNISCHQHNGFLRQLLQCEGGDSVNDDFLKLLKQAVGEERFAQLEKGDIDEIIDCFEMKMCSLQTNSSVNMKIPASLAQKKPFLDDVKITTHKLRVSSERYHQLFEKTITAIERSMKQILQNEQSKELEYILMIGEFSKCEIVQRAIRNKFPEKRIIVSVDTDCLVLKGAIYYGGILKTPISEVKYTYGIQHWPKFDNSRHALDKLVVIDGVIRCKDVFYKYIEKGDRIPTARRISYVYRQFASSSGTIDCTVYISTKSDPVYVDDDECAVLGVLRTNFTANWKGLVEIEQSLIFGETCISLQAKDMVTGKVCETQIEYV